jgi:hypothetical protein
MKSVVIIIVTFLSLGPFAIVQARIKMTEASAYEVASNLYKYKDTSSPEHIYVSPRGNFGPLIKNGNVVFLWSNIQ